ncbi:hypothetical protein D3C75_1313070 [compost metagenome]
MYQIIHQGIYDVPAVRAAIIRNLYLQCMAGSNQNLQIIIGLLKPLGCANLHLSSFSSLEISQTLIDRIILIDHYMID